jgi:hypothetical protein
MTSPPDRSVRRLALLAAPANFADSIIDRSLDE